MRTIQEMSTETFEQETAKLIAYLSAAYPAVPRLANCKDIFSMLILIHETYNGISSQYNIQGTIQNTIRNFGVTNNDSPMDFATELHTYLHNAHKLNQNINISNLRVMLRQHVQTQGAQIDSVIRERIMTFTEPSHEMIELIRALQDLTIQHACPTGTSRSFMASTPATVTPSSTQLSPSQLYSQQKDAQQGLRSATPQPKTSNSDGAGRNGDTTLFTHPHGICQTFLKHRSCPYGHDCKFIHVANPGCLLGPDGHSLHRPTDLRPYRNYSNEQQFSQNSSSRYEPPQRQARMDSSASRYSDSRSNHGADYQDRPPSRVNSFEDRRTPTSTRYGDNRLQQDERNQDRYPTRSHSSGERRDLTPGRVGFVDEQYRGSRNSQSPHRFRDSTTGRQSTDYRRTSSPRPNIKHHDQRPASESRSPSAAAARQSADGQYRTASLRNTPGQDDEYLDMRPPFARSRNGSHTDPRDGDSYNETKKWQSPHNRSQSSFAHSAQMEVNKVDPIQSQRDKMVENFFDAVRSDDQVHGRMLRISSVPAPQPWKGTSATWQSIKALS